MSSVSWPEAIEWCAFFLTFALVGWIRNRR